MQSFCPPSSLPFCSQHGHHAHHALSTNMCNSPPQPRGKPKTVGIAGAGIAGLSTAIALLKTPGTGVDHVTIFEPREDLDPDLGAALNINGAAAILTKCYGLDLWRIGRPFSYVRAMDTSGSVLFDVDVQKVLDASPKASEWLCSDGHHLFMTVMRDRLLQALNEEAVNLGVVIHRGEGNKVLGVHQDGNKASFHLANGKESPFFNLLVGADGIRSAVRTYVAPDTGPSKYSGIRVQWAIAPPGQCDLPPGRVEQWFGNGGYVLRYAAKQDGALSEILALSFREKEQSRENFAYQSESDIRSSCERRLIDCGMPPAVMQVFKKSIRFIETSVYYHDILQTWSRGGLCTLVGDSAHAMPPFLGQGANQAVQDAHSLALSLTSIGGSSDTLDKALLKYELARQIPTTAILQSSRVVGFLETLGGPVGSAARNNLFRVMGLSGGAGQILIQSATPRILKAKAQ